MVVVRGGETPPTSKFARFESGFTRVVATLTALLLLGIVVVITYQVVARYQPWIRVPRWTEEVSLILMVWLSLIGSGLGLRAGEHLAMDIVVSQLPGRFQRILKTLFTSRWQRLVFISPGTDSN